MAAPVSSQTNPLQRAGMPPATSGGKLNLLVVDDRPENLMALQAVLETLGQNVVCVRSGAEALRECLSRTFAVILLDVNMPAMDGYETAALIRQRHASEYTPIIFVTAGSPTDTHVSRGYALGAVDYLFSPIEPEVVRAKVGVFIDLARKTAVIREQAEQLRAAAERRAARLETRMHAIMNRLDVGIYRATLDGDLLDANPACLRLLRLPTLDADLFSHAREVGTGKSLKWLLGSQGPLNSTTPVADHELEFADGTTTWISLRKSVTALEADHPCVDGIVGDISQRKADERLLREANRALQSSNDDLNQFAYAATHDLKEPLRMVATYSELLKRDYAGKLGPDADEYIGFVTEGARRVERLLEDLLAYAHAGNVDVNTVAPVVESGSALDAALLNLHRAIEVSGAEIARGELPAVAMHETHLVQIFQNLIANAIKYRGTNKPLIRVSCRREGRIWRFSVADNGIGIAQEYHEQIFGLFKRLHGKEYPGTGIGLAICAKIVERYGGRIWVESAPGRGATFHFEVP
jgi:signal transduction histidine kinase